jgi:hypothetical protein
MSTRAVIAYRTEGNKWQGVYNHFDGYPTGLGRKLWEDFHANYAGETATPRTDIVKFIQERIKEHKGGWSDFPNSCYCHTRGEADSNMVIDSDHSDPLFHEFIYIFNPDRKELTILSSADKTSEVKLSGDMNDRHKVVGENDNGHIIGYGLHAYGYDKLGDFDLLGEMPNWKKLELKAKEVE